MTPSADPPESTPRRVKEAGTGLAANARGSGRGATAQRLLLDNHQTEIFGLAPSTPSSGPHVEELMSRGQLDLDLLRSRMKSAVATEVESWFEGLATPSLKYLAIAVALLDGLPYQSVVEPAESLERRLTRPIATTQAAATAVPGPFAGGRTHRVRQIRAGVIRSEITTRLGRVPAEIIRYLDLAYPRAVLDLVWR